MIIARTGAVIAITECALFGSSSAASAEMVLARSLQPTAQKSVKVKRQLRRTRVRHTRRTSSQRGRTAARVTMPSNVPARAAGSPGTDTFADRFNAAFPSTKGD
jgi:hypothetical protein